MNNISNKSNLNIGKKYGFLTVLSVERKNQRTYYKCLCDCGNIYSARADSIKNGHTKSCGCYKNKTASAIGKGCAIDITNQRFGKLVALYRDPEQKAGEKTKWICQCDCGNKTSVYTTNLVRLHTTSCGCACRSIGEENIELLLQKNNISYKREYSFSDLIDKHKLRFDFAIFDKNNKLIELIEFDGRQHNNEYVPWNSEESLLERQRRDNLKNTYCANKNIKLIRIPYYKRDTITLSDLELEQDKL